MYLCVFLRGFDYTQKKPTEIWEDNASCIMMSENPTNRDQDMSNAWTKNLARPAFEKHREYMWGTRKLKKCIFQVSLVLSILRLSL